MISSWWFHRWRWGWLLASSRIAGCVIWYCQSKWLISRMLSSLHIAICKWIHSSRLWSVIFTRSFIFFVEDVLEGQLFFSSYCFCTTEEYYLRWEGCLEINFKSMQYFSPVWQTSRLSLSSYPFRLYCEKPSFFIEPIQTSIFTLFDLNWRNADSEAKEKDILSYIEEIWDRTIFIHLSAGRSLQANRFSDLGFSKGREPSNRAAFS